MARRARPQRHQRILSHILRLAVLSAGAWPGCALWRLLLGEHKEAAGHPSYDGDWIAGNLPLTRHREPLASGTSESWRSGRAVGHAAARLVACCAAYCDAGAATDYGYPDLPHYLRPCADGRTSYTQSTLRQAASAGRRGRGPYALPGAASALQSLHSWSC